MGSGQSKQPSESVSSTVSKSSDGQPPVTVPAKDNQGPANTDSVPAEQNSESKCPMHRSDGSYSFDWAALLRPSFPHGPNGKKPLSEEEAKAKIARRATALDAGFASPGGLCPVQHREYNVYSQPIDPSNNMPQNPNQLPAPEQTANLSTDRVKSNIPKGGAADGTTWTYPSAQMFYNALARKGKLGDTREEEIDSVVALHNNMNEKTWKTVLEWEAATASSPLDPTNEEKMEAPKLLKFTGRPKDLSPKAWMKHKLLGHPLPFDRHDWTILRPNGTTVRYVIDYYYDETRAREDDKSGMPDMNDSLATPSLLVDVRPALDGPSQLFNRTVRMPYMQWSGVTSYQYMPLWPTDEMRNQVKESVDVWKTIQAKANGESTDEPTIKPLSEKEAQALRTDMTKAIGACRALQRKVDQCQSDNECAKASLDLTIGMGKILCPLQHSHFGTALSNTDETKIEHTLERLGECVVLRSTQYDALQSK